MNTLISVIKTILIVFAIYLLISFLIALFNTFIDRNNESFDSNFKEQLFDNLFNILNPFNWF